MTNEMPRIVSAWPEEIEGEDEIQMVLWRAAQRRANPATIASHGPVAPDGCSAAANAALLLAA